MIRAIIFLAFSTVLFSCHGEFDDQKTEPQIAQKLNAVICATSDNDAIRLKMAPLCESCHGDGSSRPGFASLAAFEDLIVYNPRFVVPGKPDESELVRLLEGTGTGAYIQMPTAGPPFSELAADGEVDITMDEIKDWITNLGPRSTVSTPDPDAVSSRRLSAEEYLRAMQIALGHEPSGGNNPVLQTDGRPPLAPDSVTIQPNYLNSGRMQIFNMLGGQSYLAQQRPEESWSATSMLTSMQLAQGACSKAVDENNSVLFRFATAAQGSATDAAAIRKNVGYLYERFLYEAATDEEIDRLYENVFLPAESTDTKTAWTEICSALFRDPVFMTY